MASSQSGVFVLHGDHTLVAMQPAQFAAEVDFQDLLTKFPALLVGDQIDSENPRRFILIKQEQPIGHGDDVSRWSADHLFLDQDGVPTLVEVMRQSDTRIRREVVGQMLDYAANCQSFWTADSIRTALQDACLAAEKNVDAVLAEFIDTDISIETFWANVQANLQAGKLRMLFVADHIPSELKRIVEFLNEQMRSVEVLAIELRQFAGDNLKTLVPMVFGQTQKAAQNKAPIKGTKWTEDRLLQEFETKFSAAEVRVARGILDWMKDSGLPLQYGVGRENGSVFPIFRPKGVAINPAYLSTDGKLWLQPEQLVGKPIFNDLALRRELVDLFAKVDGSYFKNGGLEGNPTLRLSTIAADPHGLEKVLAAYTWLFDRVLNES